MTERYDVIVTDKRWLKLKGYSTGWFKTVSLIIIAKTFVYWQSTFLIFGT